MADDMRTLGYICPKCGAQVMGARSVFEMCIRDRLTAVIVALAIAAPSIRKWAAFQQRKLAAGKGGN